MIHLPPQFYLALRYLDIRPARRKNFLSILNVAISVGGVALGVMSLVITLGVMSGFQTEIRKRIIGFNPHVVVFNPTDVTLISEKSGVEKDYIRPFIVEQSVIQSPSVITGVVIKGIDDETTRDIGPMEIKPGRDLARTLGVSIGDYVTVYAKSGYSDAETGGDMAFAFPRIVRLKVSGFFETGMYEYDANTALTTLGGARYIFNMKKNTVTALGIFLKQNPDDSTTIARRIIARLPSAKVRTWQQMNRSLFAALKLEKIMMFIVLTLIVVVASFNIVSNLTLFVSQKSRDIGILKSMGMTNDKISGIFVGVGLLLGLVGIVVGLIVGLGVCFALMKYDIIRLPADVYFISRLPIKILIGDIIYVVVASMIISILAALWPALKASRMNVSDILKVSG